MRHWGAEMAETEQKSGRGWGRWVLIASLTLNVLALGVLGGVVLRAGPPMMRAMPGDIGLGAYSEALDDADRRALRRSAMEHLGDLRSLRREGQEDMARLAAALRADPWDEAAVRAALASQKDRLNRRADLAGDLLLQRLAAMTPEARRAFADRLEALGARRR